MKNVFLLILIFSIYGCEVTQKTVFGIDKEERDQEIDAAYQSGEISQTQYLELKKQNEADQIENKGK